MNGQELTGLRYSSDNWFTCVDTVVMTDKYLSPIAKYVFAVLCAIAGFGCRSCSPSDEEVADLAGVAVRTVLRAYDELAARGVISRTESNIWLIGHHASCYGEEDAL